MDLKVLKIVTATGTNEYNTFDATARNNSTQALQKVQSALKTATLKESYEELTGELTLQVETTTVGDA